MPGPGRIALLVIVLLVVVAAAYAARLAMTTSSLGGQITSSQLPAVPVFGTTTPTNPFGVPQKASGCQVNGSLPDRACTPGAVFPTADSNAICRSGYASSVRNVSTSEKNRVYAAYGITSHPTGAYEVDHLISLELGGSNDAANLWPEAADPAPGFHQKDAVENYLHDQVCNGSMPLLQAQQTIALDWLGVYNRLPASAK